MNARPIQQTLRVATVVVALFALSVLGGVASATAQQVSGGSGPLVDLQLETASPTDSAAAEFTVAETGGSTTFRFGVRGLAVPVGTTYEANLHHGLCLTGDAGAAGPRYNSTGQPALIAMSPNEVSLNFVVSIVGDGSAETTVPFVIAAGTANSVVIYDADGAAIACLPVTIADSTATVTTDEVQGISQTAPTTSGPADSPDLAFTGAESESLAAIGLALVGAGAAVLVARRRLENSETRSI